MEEKNLKSDTMTVIKHYETFRLLAILSNQSLHIQVTQYGPNSPQKIIGPNPNRSYQENKKQKQLKAIYQKGFTNQNLPSELKKSEKTIYDVLKSFWDDGVQIKNNKQNIRLFYKLPQQKGTMKFFKRYQLVLETTIHKQDYQKVNPQFLASNQKAISLNQPNQTFFKQIIYSGQQLFNIQSLKQQGQKLLQQMKGIEQRYHNQLTKIIAQLQEIRQSKTGLQKKVEEFIQKIKHHFDQIKQTPYKFSQTYKNRYIQIASQKQKASCNHIQGSLKAVLIQPLTLKPTTYQNATNYQINFKIKKVQYYVAFGICDKNTLKQANYHYTKRQTKHIGCYLLDWGGQIWSDYQKKKYLKPFERLKFKAQDTIKVTFDSTQKILRFMKNQRPQQSIQIKIDPKTDLNQLCFCAFVSSCGDQVKIINNNKKRHYTQNQDDNDQSDIPHKKKKINQEQPPMVFVKYEQPSPSPSQRQSSSF